MIRKLNSVYLFCGQNGSVALHHACYSEIPNLEVVQLLVGAGADVNALDEQGYSPLIVAAKKSQTEAIDFLRKHGADTTLKNSVRAYLSPPLNQNVLVLILFVGFIVLVWRECAALRGAPEQHGRYPHIGVTMRIAIYRVILDYLG